MLELLLFGAESVGPDPERQALDALHTAALPPAEASPAGAAGVPRGAPQLDLSDAPAGHVLQDDGLLANQAVHGLPVARQIEARLQGSAQEEQGSDRDARE